MSKMTCIGKNHGHTFLVTNLDRILISDGSTRLDNGLDAHLGCQLDAVVKGEEGVTGQDCPCEVSVLVVGLDGFQGPNS